MHQIHQIHQIRFLLIMLGEFTALPRLHSCIKRTTSKGKEGKRAGKRMEGGGKWKEKGNERGEEMVGRGNGGEGKGGDGSLSHPKQVKSPLIFPILALLGDERTKPATS